MPTARELNQKLADVSVGWPGFLAEAHRLLNAADLSGELSSAINTLAIPSKYTTTEQRVQQAINLLTQTQNRMRDSIAKLRTFLTY